MRPLHSLVLLGALAFLASSTQAEVKLPSFFSDHMVLQRGMPVPVWGNARDGEKVTVQFQNQTVSTTAKDGRWMVKLDPLKAGGPFDLKVAGDNALTIGDVLVGEVWVCSGQSNMERQLGLRKGQQPLKNWEQEAASANYPMLRHFGVVRNTSDTPLTDVTGKWEICTPQTVPSFTAVGYYFGRDLLKALNVPIGLLHTSVGGTPAEAWTSKEALESNPMLQAIFTRYADAVKNFPEAKEKHRVAMEAHAQAAAAATAEGKTPPPAPKAPQDPTRSSSRPAGLYNAMLAPLQPYAIRGVIWYQGESNNGRHAEYQTLFPAMIANWRQAWKQGDFPFLFVQIAPFKNMSPEIREAQLLSWKKTPLTAMVVTTDHGDANDIHPTEKEPVGERLALAARALAYNEKIEYSGPVFEKLKIDGPRAVLSFSHLGGGLVAKDGPLKGFAIAGADGTFFPAEGSIKGDTVVVTSKDVAAPAAVSYGWSNVPDINLFNKAGLPASPFRTNPPAAP